jgi:hypothetical protein
MRTITDSTARKPCHWRSRVTLLGCYVVISLGIAYRAIQWPIIPPGIPEHFWVLALGGEINWPYDGIFPISEEWYSYYDLRISDLIVYRVHRSEMATSFRTVRAVRTLCEDVGVPDEGLRLADEWLAAGNRDEDLVGFAKYCYEMARQKERTVESEPSNERLFHEGTARAARLWCNVVLESIHLWLVATLALCPMLQHWLRKYWAASWAGAFVFLFVPHWLGYVRSTGFESDPPVLGAGVLYRDIIRSFRPLAHDNWDDIVIQDALPNPLGRLSQIFASGQVRTTRDKVSLPVIIVLTVFFGILGFIGGTIVQRGHVESGKIVE